MLHGEAPHGDLPFGDSVVSATIEDVVNVLLQRPWIPRSWLLRALPRDASTATDPPTLIPVNLSTDGNRWSPTDAEEIQFPEALVQPYSLSFSLSRDLWGQSRMRSGQIAIGDASLEHRSLAGEDWVGRQCDVYVGPRGGAQVEFARVARLISRQISYDRKLLTIIVDDHSFIFDKPLQSNLYLGTGSLEGGAEIEGQPKPITIGQVRHVAPIVVDSATNIFQLHDGAFEAVDLVEDRGLAVTFNADVADIVPFAPPPGTFNTSLATGYIRLGTKPDLLTVDAKGHNSSLLGYVETISSIIRLLATVFAGLVDPSELDITSFTDLESRTAKLGHYFTSPIKIKDAMELFHQSGGSFGWLQPSKILKVGRITDPDGETEDFTIDASKDELRNDPWSVIPWEIPTYKVTVGYRRYQRPVSPTDLDPTKTLAEQKDYCQEYRYLFDEDLSVLTQTPEAADITILTSIDRDVDARAFVVEQLSLRKVPRRLGTFSPRVGLIQRGIGDVLELIDDRLPDSPKKFFIIGVTNSASSEGRSDNIVLECFG